jgi:monoamine oxidase
VGGRIHTDRSLGIPIELGANRIRGIRRNPIVPLLDESGVEFVPFEWDNLTGISSKGHPFDEQKLASSRADLMNMMTRAFFRNVGRAENASVEEIVRKELSHKKRTPEELEILNFSLATGEILNGASFSDTSWKFIRDFEEYKGDEQFVTNGYDALPNLLSEGLDIRKNQNVQAIEYDEQGVRVTTQRTSIQADFAIITVSLGVLQAESITFSPELPWRKKRAINRMGMGQVNKIAIRYPKQFWPEGHHALVHGTHNRGNFPAFINMAKYTQEPVLLTQVCTSHKNALTGMSKQDAVHEAHEILRGMYGSGIPYPTKAVRSDWGENPFVLGAFSYNKTGAKTQDRSDLADSIVGRLFFAGEATHRKKYGSVSGAYISGQRAAREVLQATPEPKLA